MANNSTILFESLKNILTDKSVDIFKEHTQNDQKWKSFSKFIVLRYLTMSTNEKVRNIVLDNILTLDRMPPKQMYMWLINKIPRQSNSFIRYIK